MEETLSFFNFFNTELVISIGVALFNGLILGYTGFGGALIIVPVLTYIYGPIEAIGISCIIAIVAGCKLVYETRKEAEWSQLLPIFMGIAILTPLGTALLFNIEPETTTKIMGGVILIFAIILFSGWSYHGPRGLIPSGIVGSIAGIINGLSGMGGPALALYYLSAPLIPNIQRANIAVCVIALTVVMFFAILVGGGYSLQVFLRALIIAPGYLLGVFIGANLFRIAPKTYFKKVALLIIIITGVSVLLS
tara:strand:+ start:1058 stop:1807 length:750 start_codon:yes stop_codon:yes gene_type:complete